MSDHEHDEHEGGHEVDNMPSRKLFNLLFGLSALTLLACIGVVQLFNRQVDSIEHTRAGKMSFQLAEYRQEMDDIEKDWGVVRIKDDDGVPEAEGGKGPHEAVRYQMPLAEARKRVLESPDKYLKAQRPYRGGRNPDPNAPAAAARPMMPRAPGAAVQPRPVAPTVLPAPVPAPAPEGAQPQPAAPAPKGAEPNEGAAPAEGKGNEGKGPKANEGEGKGPKGDEGKAPAPADGDEGN
ncbi:MAG: hypothetical protein KC501_33750 [Myxococcales bacterium]|nr:hypothetical protein [Myxococcales bacterium]